MAIPSKQIGWSQRANLLWQISKQLQYLTSVMGRNITTSTTTTTAVPTTTTTTTIAPTTTSTTTAVPIVYGYYNVSTVVFGACVGGVPPTSVGVPNGDVYNATVIYADFNETVGGNATVYIGFTYAGTNYSKQFITSPNGTSATATGGNVAC